MSFQTAPDAGVSARQSKLVIDFVAAAMNAGDVAEAERLLRDRLLRAPHDAEALAKLAEIAVADRRIEEATVLLRRAADADPRLPRYVSLIRHLEVNVGPAAVLQAVDTVPPRLRYEHELRAREARAFGNLGLHDRQIPILEELTSALRTYPQLWLTLPMH